MRASRFISERVPARPRPDEQTRIRIPTMLESSTVAAANRSSSLLVIVILLLSLLFLLLDRVKGVVRDRVEAEHGLPKYESKVKEVSYEATTDTSQRVRSRGGTHAVRVLDEHITTFRLAQSQISHGSHDPPTVRKRNVHLRRKLFRLQA